MTIYTIYPCSDAARERLDLEPKLNINAEAVGIQSLPADTVYPFDAMNVGESIAISTDVDLHTVGKLYQEANLGVKRFEILKHDEHKVYEIFRAYDRVIKQKTQTKQYIEAKDTIEETSEEDLNIKSKGKHKGRVPRYPFGELQVGQSFIYHYESTTKAKLYNAMKNYERRYDKRFRLISNDKGEVYRVHRER